MKKEAISTLNGKVSSTMTVLTQLMRLHQITCGHVKTDDGEIKPIKNNRIKELMSVLEETDGKVIIWAVYRHDIQTIEKEIADVYGKETVASYYGDTKDDIRQSIVDNFMVSDGDLRFFIGNPKTGAMALLLLAVTLLCITLMITA